MADDSYVVWYSAAQSDVKDSRDRSALPRASEIDAVHSKVACPHNFAPVSIVAKLKHEW